MHTTRAAATIGYWKLHYCTLFLSYAAAASKRAYQIHFAANWILPSANAILFCEMSNYIEGAFYSPRISLCLTLVKTHAAMAMSHTHACECK